MLLDKPNIMKLMEVDKIKTYFISIIKCMLKLLSLPHFLLLESFLYAVNNNIKLKLEAKETKANQGNPGKGMVLYSLYLIDES